MVKAVPYLSEEAIEQDAAALLSEFARVRRIKIAPPIPIEDIIEKHLKLRIEFDDTHKLFGVPRPALNPDILGAMFFDEARIVIDESLDPDENPGKEGRYRFTLAHEGGGHWRLHRQQFTSDSMQTALFEATSQPMVICRSSQAKERVEWQADFYASCLLMPRALVIEAWRSRFGTTDPFVFELHKDDAVANRRRSTWIHLSVAVGKALGVPDEPDFKLCFNRISREFAQVFNVSTEAMCIRLEKLGLLLRDLPAQMPLHPAIHNPFFEESVKC